VVDIVSRHLSAEDAALRAAALPNEAGAHKIDSTLRGNWAHELVARHAATAMPVMIVPALPAMGRVCVDGEVLVDGTPVHVGVAGSDIRAGVSSSRPAEHLRAAGALDVLEIGSIQVLDEWFGAAQGCAVVDAVTDHDIEAIVSRWTQAGAVLLAGSSATIAATAGTPPTPGRCRLGAPVLVVCGSANARARRQIDIAVELGTVSATSADAAVTALHGGKHVVVGIDAPIGRVGEAEAESTARALAGRVRQIVASVGELGALVVIGGDTAAAVLGDATVQVLGSVTPGTAWVESPQFAYPVVTRAGGFGDEHALAELLWGTLPS
jgi:uncharacterized protein YgbK (DUF1537 family)